MLSSISIKATRSYWLAFLFLISGISSKATEIHWPEFLISGIEEEIVVEADDFDQIEIRVNDEVVAISTESPLSQQLIIEVNSEVEVFVDGYSYGRRSYIPIPPWMSILPPLLAILLALVFREVIVSLFLGLFAGTLIPAIYTFGITGIVPAFLRITDKYIVNSLFDTGHISVIVFSMLIGATVSLISKNGGMAGVVDFLSRYAKSRRSGQMVTWFLGIAIFFDDYANTLIVGNTMRPVTDKLKISREKLAYIVDSTAAPIAAIAFVTTWIGAELGYIQDGIRHISSIEQSVYQVFLASLKYSYYPIFTLIFVAMLIWMKKDYGPMLSAEQKPMLEKEEQGSEEEASMKDFQAAEGIPKKAFNAILPVSVIVIVTLIGLIYTGYTEEIWVDDEMSFFRKLSATIGQADTYLALLWSSLTGLVLASAMTLIQKLLSVGQVTGSVMNGFKTMLTAMVILVLAWSLSAVTEDLHTADFLTNSISDGLSPFALPLATFILAALVSFSTGSSWGTMAILYPMMLPLSWTVCAINGLDVSESLDIFYNVVSCVLAGSVLGDHCSPISDTTILSSLASSCNHIEHVRTQLPYALTAGGVAIVFGTIPSSFGSPFLLNFALGLGAMFFVIKKFGRDT